MECCLSFFLMAAAWLPAISLPHAARQDRFQYLLILSYVFASDTLKQDNLITNRRDAISKVYCLKVCVLHHKIWKTKQHIYYLYLICYGHILYYLVCSIYFFGF